MSGVPLSAKRISVLPAINATQYNNLRHASGTEADNWVLALDSTKRSVGNEGSDEGSVKVKVNQLPNILRDCRCAISRGSNDPSAEFTIGGSNTGGLGTISSIFNRTITVVSEQTQFVLGSLVNSGEVNTSDTSDKLMFHVELLLQCYPITQSPYYVPIKVMHGDYVVAAYDYRMSSTATSSSPDMVALSFDFHTGNTSETFNILGNSDYPIKAKLSRITVTRL